MAAAARRLLWRRAGHRRGMVRRRPLAARSTHRSAAWGQRLASPAAEGAVSVIIAFAPGAIVDRWSDAVPVAILDQTVMTVSPHPRPLSRVRGRGEIRESLARLS
ncbi:hypothetical protein ACCAA_310004 [Candidatus Accumulibacter aalborgensis]|uniref:Uncharacterized protein n=1 Tax=Candidatus Accumulibacter aalborgensis TaxID=1860102 RepID=A0A1A8XQK0_9PROT|nr:hypothetical protein ACCAA_310004 [Candidatus Accumulibacter aalborgensis]